MAFAGTSIMYFIHVDVQHILGTISTFFKRVFFGATFYFPQFLKIGAISV